MTPEEVYREIDRDMPAVSAWWMRERVTLERIAKMTTWRFPFTRWYEHTSKRGNRYMVMSILMGRKYNDENLTSVFALQKMERGYAVYFTRWPWQMLGSRIVELPHVFDRYADPKRGNVQKTGIELIKHFVEHNAYGVPTTDQRFSGRSVRYKGRDNHCLSMNDGVLLGERQGDIFLAHTFITYDMAIGLQRKEFEKNKDKLLSNQELQQEMKQIYNIQLSGLT